MPSRTLHPEIHERIEARDFATLKTTVAAMEVHELTALLSDLEAEEALAMVFRLLPAQQAAEVFGDLPVERREDLVRTLSSEKVAAIVNDMPPDERTELLEELPGQLAQRLLNLLRGEQQTIARALLNYPEQSIGRRMTPQYVAVRADWTTDQVFEHIRKVAEDTETFNVLYVVDDQWRLLDELTLEQVVLAGHDVPVADLMDSRVAPLCVTDDRETAVDEFKKYEAVALPVVDTRGILVGIVTVDDVLDVAEAEDTEDFQKMAGMGALEYSYFGTGLVGMIRKRLPWLVLLLAAQLLTTVALTSFHTVPLFAVLVVFMPLINSPGGNTGSQIAGLMIRGLAVQEVAGNDWLRVLRCELARGLVLGLILGLLGYGASMLFARALPTQGYDPGRIAMSVAAALAVVVTLANLVGSMLPFFFKRVGMDPAVTSGPFIASIMDVAAILIYFSTAAIVLHA